MLYYIPMSRLILVSLFLLSFTLIFSGTTYAVSYDTAGTATDDVTPGEAKMKQKRAVDNDTAPSLTGQPEDRPAGIRPSFSAADRCEVLRARIQFFNQNRETHNKHYRFLIDRLTQLSEKLAASGHDVEKLNSAISTLSDMVDVYLGLMDDLISQLTGLEEFVCVDDVVSVSAAADYRDGLMKAKEVLEQARDQRDAIRTYYRDVIRPLIAELRVEVTKDTRE